MNKWRALKVACGILVAVLAFRVFYFQELFFAFLLFTTAYLLLLLLVAVVLCLLYAYVRGVTYVAARASVRASHLAASSRASPVAGPHGHNNGPCAACLPAVIVLSVSWLDAGLAALLLVRCRPTPSGRRESPKGLEAPGQAELKPRPARALCGRPSGTGALSSQRSSMPGISSTVPNSWNSSRPAGARPSPSGNPCGQR